MQFQFPASQKREITVSNSQGEVLKTWWLDVGNPETLKKALANFKKMIELGNRLQKDSSDFDSIIDDIMAVQKSIVDDLIGDYDYLWIECHEDIWNMKNFITALIEEVNTAIKAKNEI